MSATARAVNENLRTATKARIKRASALARRRMNQFDAQTLEQLDRIYRTAIADLQATIRGYSSTDGNIKLETLRQLLNQSQQRLGQLNTARDALLNEALPGAASIALQPFAGELAEGSLVRIADEAVQFVNNLIEADGLQLSDRIWRINNHATEIVGNAINNAVVQGHSASQAANDFLSRGQPVPADIAGKVNAANADNVARVVGRDLMASGSPRHNAMRLFRTELNRAHGEAYMTSGADHPDFAGWRFLLSPNHPEADICDMHARANLHGLGPGVYPTRERCPWPAHPNTLSYVEIVFSDEISAEDRAGKTTRLDWLKNQPGSVQQSVLNSRKKAAALNSGILRENEIATPWNALKARYTRRGIDVDALRLPPQPPPKQTGATLVTGMDRDAFDSYAAAAFRHAPDEITQLINKTRKPALVEVVKTKGSWYTGDKLHLSQNSMRPRKGFHSMHDVYRHEYGHFVDYWARAKEGRITTPLSSLPRSSGGLKTAIDAAKRQLRSSAASQVERRARIMTDLRGLMDTNLADLFGALTNNRVGWGHSKAYLSRRGFSETEIFANMFDAYSRNDRGAWNFIKTELPELADEFVKILNSEVKA